MKRYHLGHGTVTSYSIFITTDWIHLETAKQHDLHWTFKDFDLIFIFLYDIYKKKKKTENRIRYFRERLLVDASRAWKFT